MAARTRLQESVKCEGVKIKICSKVKRGGWVTKYKVRREGGRVAKSKW